MDRVMIYKTCLSRNSAILVPVKVIKGFFISSFVLHVLLFLCSCHYWVLVSVSVRSVITPPWYDCTSTLWYQHSCSSLTIISALLLYLLCWCLLCCLMLLLPSARLPRPTGQYCLCLTLYWLPRNMGGLCFSTPSHHLHPTPWSLWIINLSQLKV